MNKDRYAKRAKTCYYRLIVFCLLSLLLVPYSFAAETPDSSKVADQPSIYGGMTLKLDIGAAALTPALSKGKLQQYELAMNWQLKHRFYPTLELGYAGGRTNRGDTIQYNAHGGYFRVGCDVNPLKKHPDSPHAMLLGIRIGTGFQPKKTDCWGEIVAGCQVNLVKGFYMGWMGRLKILFTRQNEGLPAEEVWPIYIPGYGKRDNIAWGLSYHIGYKF